MSTFNEKRILDLERKSLPYKWSVAGTTLSRVLLDHGLFEEEGLNLEESQGKNASSLVWCLALGQMMEPKIFFYGRTIEEAVEKAEKVLV